MKIIRLQCFSKIYRDSRLCPQEGKLILFLLLTMTLLIGIALAAWEIRTSSIQARLFSKAARTQTYHLQPGKTDMIRYPQSGPYDIRMGYVRIPQWLDRLEGKGFEIKAQARWSPELLKTFDWGFFPVYREKNQAGIVISDRLNRDVLRTAFPGRIYPDFKSIPPVLVKMLLFIENRHLLNPSAPNQNPAVEWERLAKAIADAAIQKVDSNHDVAGGSTLATQIEKFRHSPEGITSSASEKLRQIVSASLRAYRDGEETGEARRRIAVDYINSIPLAAIPGYGEVNGLGDGLWAWYAMDFENTNRLLMDSERPDLDGAGLDEAGAAVRAALSLFLSQRRPSAYLITHRESLQKLTDTYLRLLVDEGIISKSIYQAALKARPALQKSTSLSYALDPASRKAANLIRSRLMSTLGVDRLYDLDRIDLTVKTTLDMDLQEKVTQRLMGLKDPAAVKQAGLVRPHLLDQGDPAKVVYSFSLYESTPAGNLLRVQTNNYDGPFNIDEQTKLDLGSSAKLRTLVHYLEIMTQLYHQYGDLPKIELKVLAVDKTIDPLTRWAAEYLLTTSSPDLSGMLDAAMTRLYSASPYEQFFTGGGLHTFANFRKEDNRRIMTVREAFRHSINLVFIRMMRDISYYHVYQRYGVTPRYLEKLDELEKKRLLTVFADREGSVFIRRFWQKYRRKNPVEAAELLYAGITPTPAKLTAAFRFIRPEAPIAVFSEFIKGHLPGSKFTDNFIEELYDDYSPGRFTLADIGYVAHVHPLELWVVRYLQQHPETSISQIVAESAEERQMVYQWLFKTRSSRKQFQRIRTIIELEAFQDVHLAWKRMGYPFDYLVPSYATSIGSSGDRPGALAELIGIIQNDGMRYPAVRFQALHFAKNTPYETLLTLVPAEGERVMAPEVARTVKQALLDVVNEGTARSLFNSVTYTDGTYLILGGKTGTGDHRYKTFGTGGKMLTSQVMNRAATFVFLIGDRYFGTISAYVAGGDAANYSFSSSLPVNVLKMILPEMVPLLEHKDPTVYANLPETGAERAGAM